MADYEMLLDIDGEQFSINGSDVVNDVFAFSLTRKKLGFGAEYYPEIVFATKVKVGRIGIKFLLGGHFDGESLFFNNATTTNDWVSIEKIADRCFVSRDIAMIKSDDSSFSIAMTSAENFYTTFTSNRNEISLNYEYEDKPVPAGKKIPLESFVVSDSICGGDFFEEYCTYMAEKFSIKLPEKVIT